MFVSKKCNNCGDWVDCKGVIKEEDDMVYCDVCVEKKLKNVKKFIFERTKHWEEEAPYIDYDSPARGISGICFMSGYERAMREVMEFLRGEIQL